MFQRERASKTAQARDKLLQREEQASQSLKGERSAISLGRSLRVIRLVLIPVDLILKIVGPRYSLYFWVFRVAPPSMVAWLGRLRAIRAADNASRNVPAYRAFLTSAHVAKPEISRLNLPPTDKENYIRVFPPEQRCLNGAIPFTDTAIDESSGSTGTPYNWIRSSKERHVSHILISHYARYCFGTEPYITINAFSITPGIVSGLSPISLSMHFPLRQVLFRD